MLIREPVRLGKTPPFTPKWRSPKTPNVWPYGLLTNSGMSPIDRPCSHQSGKVVEGSRCLRPYSQMSLPPLAAVSGCYQKAGPGDCQGTNGPGPTSVCGVKAELPQFFAAIGVQRILRGLAPS